MPYKPGSISQEDRERQYNMIWLSAACSLLNFANVFIGNDTAISAWFLGASVGGITAGLIAHRADDYFQSLVNVGLRWAGATIGIYMIAAWLLDTLDIAYSAGYMLSNDVSAVPDERMALFLTDARTLAAFTVVVFHAGYTFAWLRDRFGVAEGE